MKKNNEKYNYQKKLENACNGYSYDKFSVGRKTTMLMFNDDIYSLQNLDSRNINNLTNDILNSASNNLQYGYNEVKRHIEYLYNTQLPNLSDVEFFNKLNTEREYLDYLSKKIINNQFVFSQLPDFTKKQLIDYRNGQNEELNIHTYSKTNMLVLPGKKVGLPFDLYIRTKNPESLILKTIERTGNILVPNTKLVNKLINFNSNKKNIKEKDKLESMLGIKIDDDYELNEYLYTYGCINLINDVLKSGEDTQTYIDNISNDSMNSIFKEYVAKLFLVDNIGCRIVGQDNTINKINNYMFNSVDTLIKGKYSDFFTTKEKDLSVVVPLRVKKHDGVYLELRLQTSDRVARGDFGEEGILSHPIYKLVKSKGINCNIEKSETFKNMVYNYVKYFGFDVCDVLPHLKIQKLLKTTI